MTANKTTKETARWAMCVGALSLLVAAGAVITTSPRAAEAQTPHPGQAPFNRTCGRCHPDGNEDTGPEIRNKNLTEVRMREIIRTGTRRMRPITPQKLPDANLDAVIAYLRTMNAVRP